MSTATIWGIAAIVVTATAGDILQAGAMKEIGDLGAVRGRKACAVRFRRVSRNSRFMLGCCSWHWRSSACWSLVMG